MGLGGQSRKGQQSADFFAAQRRKTVHPRFRAAQPFAVRETLPSDAQVLVRVEPTPAQIIEIGGVNGLDVTKFGLASRIVEPRRAGGGQFLRGHTFLDQLGDGGAEP